MGKTPAPFSHGAESRASKGMEGPRKDLANYPNQGKAKESTNKDTTPSEGSTDKEQDKAAQYVCHQTLPELYKADLDTTEGPEGRNGISVHGPYCHGLRVLLIFSGSTQEMKLKVSQSAVDSD